MCNIGKSFSGSRALNRVSFDLQPGEIHALVGENGAGKSTLIKILAGVYPSAEHEGEIRIRGAARKFRGVRDSAKAGVAVVHQEIPTVPEMSIAENVLLGRTSQRMGIVQWNELYTTAAKILAELGLKLDTRLPVGGLGVGLKQMIEIAKALSRHANILVLDEPTAALGFAEAKGLFALLSDLRERGLGIIYISHRLEEVFRLSDRITVLRDGCLIGTHSTTEIGHDDVIRMMVGRDLAGTFTAPMRGLKKVVFEARNITARDRTTNRMVVDDVSLTVREGEILGIAGLVGAGRSELLMCLYGAYPGCVTGQLLVDGKKVSITRPSEAIRNGMSLVSEDRKRYGLVLEHSILHNMTMPALSEFSRGFVIDQAREIAACSAMFQRLGIKGASMFASVGSLSGGNQQKVVLAKCLLTKPRVLLLDEPTRGVDVGAKQEIYAEIERLARAGMAVIMVSSELPEILSLSDHVLVMAGGGIVTRFTRANATAEAVMAAASGATRPA